VKSICWDLTFIRATDRKDNEAVQRNHPIKLIKKIGHLPHEGWTAH
jgi:hypothetical protein